MKVFRVTIFVMNIVKLKSFELIVIFNRELTLIKMDFDIEHIFTYP